MPVNYLYINEIEYVEKLLEPGPAAKLTAKNRVFFPICQNGCRLSEKKDI